MTMPAETIPPVVFTTTTNAAPTSPVAAPAAVQPPPVPSPAPQAVQAPSNETTEPHWLKGRLEREHDKAAKDLLAKTGFSSVEEAAAAGKLVRERAEANKTAEQKAKDAETALASEKLRADGAMAFAAEHAARMMVGLTPAQQEAVKAIAGDDPVRQGQTIMRLAPTWAKAEAAAPVVAPAAPVAPPTTAPANAAPSGVVPAPADAKQAYQELRKTNPFAAAEFGDRNPSVFVPKASG